MAAVAALAATAAIVGGVELSSSGSSARVIQANVIGSSGQAQLRLSGNSAELVVRDFPSPPAGKIYEVWLRRAASPLSPTSALFSVTSSGAGDVVVPGDLHGVSEVLVTPEPAGGSEAPTHPPVIVARLTLRPPPKPVTHNRLMAPEAPLEPSDDGLVPKGEGWFVLNARDAHWLDGHFGLTRVSKAPERRTSDSTSACSSPVSQRACTTARTTRRISSCLEASVCC